MKNFSPEFSEGHIYKVFAEEDPLKKLHTSFRTNKKALLERKDRDYSKLGVSIRSATVVAVNDKKVIVGKESAKSFFFPIFGYESVGKSTFATRLALSIKESQAIDIVRIQIENTVMLAKAYDLMPPVNDHRVHFHEVEDEVYVRVFPDLLTEAKLYGLLKAHSHVFIDGMARLQTDNPRLAERGINLDAINIGIQRVPYLVEGAIVVFTIQSDKILKDLSAASQGYIQIMDTTKVEVSSPFRRNKVIRTSWLNAIDAFFLEKDSDNYNATHVDYTEVV